MIDNQKINKLLSLSDSELRKKISDAAISAGADKYLTAKALADVGKIREMLENLTPEQINAVMARFGSCAASELAKKLDDNM